MHRQLNHAWRRTAGRTAGLLATVVTVSALAGAGWAPLALTAIGLLGWQYWRLHCLTHRLLTRKPAPERDGPGIWQALETLLDHTRKTQRRRQRRLMQRLLAYRAAAEALPDAVVVVDRTTQRIAWCNRASAPLLGLTSSTDIGQPIAARLQPLPLAHWLATGRHAEPILDVPSPVSPAVRLQLRLVPYSTHHWLMIARDVTQLQHLEQVRRDFVANVSHELRTPLTVLHGYLDMLEPEDLPHTGTMLTEMRQQSERMKQLVEDLLTLSRLEATDAGSHQTVPLAPLLSALVSEARAMSRQRHVVDVIDEGDIDLIGVPGDLHSALSNLISNAVRHTPEGGRIVIQVAVREDGAAISVRDTGPGIAAEHLPRLTERFYRVSHSRSRESGGTGLGLAIVKHILSAHNARLEIRSEPGNGSTFTCLFDSDHVTVRNKP